MSEVAEGMAARACEITEDPVRAELVAKPFVQMGEITTRNADDRAHQQSVESPIP